MIYVLIVLVSTWWIFRLIQLFESLSKREITVCQRCNGCKLIANTALGEPWTDWRELAETLPQLNIVPLPCPDCCKEDLL